MSKEMVLKAEAYRQIVASLEKNERILKARPRWKQELFQPKKDNSTDASKPIKM